MVLVIAYCLFAIFLGSFRAVMYILEVKTSLVACLVVQVFRESTSTKISITGAFRIVVISCGHNRAADIFTHFRMFLNFLDQSVGVSAPSYRFPYMLGFLLPNTIIDLTG